MSKTSTPPAEVTRWGVVLLAVLAGVATSYQIGKFAPALPLMQQDLQLSLLSSGWLSSLIAVTGAFGAVVIGIVVGRLPRLTAMSLGMVVLTLGGIIGALADSAPLAFSARGIESLGFVLTAISAPRVIAAQARSRDRGLALGIWGSYMATGSALAMVLAPLIFPLAGWRGLWWVGVLFSGTVSLLCLFVANQQSIPANKNSASGPRASIDWSKLWRVVWQTGPWYLALVFACYSALYFAVTTWLPSFLIDRHGMETGTAALIGGLVVAANILGNLAGGWLMHMGVKRVQLITTGLCFMGLMAIIIFPEQVALPLRIMAAIGFSMFGGLVPSSLLASVPHHAATPAALSVVNGIIVQGANSGNLAGAPYLAASLTWFGGWQMMWLPLLFLVGCGLIVVRLLHRSESA